MTQTKYIAGAGGGGKGGGGSHTPTEADDTLQSVQFASVLDLLCEGEIEGLEDRLKSRFGWGLSVVIDPPALETRTAILLQKAEEMEINLPEDCAFFIAQQVKVRGCLKKSCR